MVAASRRRLLAGLPMAGLAVIMLVFAQAAPGARAADPTQPPRFLSEEQGRDPGTPVHGLGPTRDGFEDRVVISGRTNPMSFRFAANGRVFVGEKSGLVWTYDNLADTSPTLVADLRDNVHDYWDRGLMSIALDPDFPSSPYLYVLYASITRVGGGGRAWQDECDTPPGPTTDGCVVSGRLSRLTLDGSSRMTSEAILVNDWCAQYPSHSVGDLRFGADGALYASGGDGASFTFADYGQVPGNRGGPTEPNPCGDPPGGGGTPLSRPSSEGGALRSLSLLRASGPAVLGGTIVRLNPDTGGGLGSNPGAGSSDGNARRIVGQGLRNPFRFAIRPRTNDLWIGDVGWGTFEEINRLANPSGSPVENFGWPCYEGGDTQPTYSGLNLTLCENLYDRGSGAVADPYYAYNHASRVTSGESCPTGSSSISGITFYDGGPYPSSYDGALFFADHSRNCIWAIPAGANGLPDPSRRFAFVENARNPVDLEIGPNGDVFYADLEGGSIHRITYSAGNQAPTASFTASPGSGQAPLRVSFDARASSDPDGGSLRYAWDLDGDGSYDDATGVTTTRTYTALGSYTVGLKVTDAGGKFDTASRTVNVSNAPTPVIDAPIRTLSWTVGQRITFRGHARDPQDGTLPPSALSWSLVLHHCPSNCHAHALQTIDDVASGSFAAPDHDYPSYLTLTLTATDSDGLQGSTTVRLNPRTVVLTLRSNPSRLQIAVSDYQPTGTPFTRRVIVGSRNVLSAVEPQKVGRTTYVFQYWSIGGGQTRTIVAPSTSRTYTATFAPGNEPGDAPNTCASTTRTSPSARWIAGTIRKSGDADWYRFRLTTARTVRLVLGDLPADYRLDLYGSCGRRIALSDRGGKVPEEIIRRLPAGYYRVRVTGHGSASSDSRYALRFLELRATNTILSHAGWVGNDGRLRIAGEVTNTSTLLRRAGRVTVTLHDGANRVLARRTAGVLLDSLRPYAHVPFLVTFTTPPSGYDHYSITFTSTAGASKVAGGLVIAAQATTTDDDGHLLRPGTLRNGNRFAVRSAKVVAIAYSARGSVLNVGAAGLGALRARATVPFSILLDDRPVATAYWSIRAQAFR